MQLALFIEENSEKILAEWEAHARTLLPSSTGMSSTELRDHGRQILQTISLDIETEQTKEQQDDKAKGLGLPQKADVSAASKHGTDREDSGFTLEQLTGEYRALRASVLRLWYPHVSHITEETANDIMRFNEAIDQALAESVATYAKQAARARTTFLAILGHDLRNPLATVTNAGEALTMLEAVKVNTHEIGIRVQRSAATMTAMVNDLLEYAGSQLGSKMPVRLVSTDLKDICEAAQNDAMAVHPECQFALDVAESADLRGSFDSVRLQQALTNLLNNAAQYRAKDRPVTIIAQGEPDSVAVEVWNFGPVIPTESLQAIFDPLVQLSAEGHLEGRPSASLGLGLFIAREIVTSHGGTIDVESSENSGTVFTVRLPRRHTASPDAT